ncbi:16012_t:CDS:1, partial [Acaulospora morrowiae]
MSKAQESVKRGNENSNENTGPESTSNTPENISDNVVNNPIEVSKDDDGGVVTQRPPQNSTEVLNLPENKKEIGSPGIIDTVQVISQENDGIISQAHVEVTNSNIQHKLEDSTLTLNTSQSNLQDKSFDAADMIKGQGEGLAADVIRTVQNLDHGEGSTPNVAKETQSLDNSTEPPKVIDKTQNQGGGFTSLTETVQGIYDASEPPNVTGETQVQGESTSSVTVAVRSQDQDEKLISNFARTVQSLENVFKSSGVDETPSQDGNLINNVTGDGLDGASKPPGVISENKSLIEKSILNVTEVVQNIDVTIESQTQGGNSMANVTDAARKFDTISKISGVTIETQNQNEKIFNVTSTIQNSDDISKLSNINETRSQNDEVPNVTGVVRDAVDATKPYDVIEKVPNIADEAVRNFENVSEYPGVVSENKSKSEELTPNVTETVRNFDNATGINHENRGQISPLEHLGSTGEAQVQSGGFAPNVTETIRNVNNISELPIAVDKDQSQHDKPIYNTTETIQNSALSASTSLSSALPEITNVTSVSKQTQREKFNDVASHKPDPDGNSLVYIVPHSTIETISESSVVYKSSDARLQPSNEILPHDRDVGKVKPPIPPRPRLKPKNKSPMTFSNQNINEHSGKRISNDSSDKTPNTSQPQNIISQDFNQKSFGPHTPVQVVVPSNDLPQSQQRVGQDQRNFDVSAPFGPYFNNDANKKTYDVPVQRNVSQGFNPSHIADSTNDTLVQQNVDHITSAQQHAGKGFYQTSITGVPLERKDVAPEQSSVSQDFEQRPNTPTYAQIAGSTNNDALMGQRNVTPAQVRETVNPHNLDKPAQQNFGQGPPPIPKRPSIPPRPPKKIVIPVEKSNEPSNTPVVNQKLPVSTPTDNPFSDKNTVDGIRKESTEKKNVQSAREKVSPEKKKILNPEQGDELVTQFITENNRADYDSPDNSEQYSHGSQANSPSQNNSVEIFSQTIPSDNDARKIGKDSDYRVDFRVHHTEQTLREKDGENDHQRKDSQTSNVKSNEYASDSNTMTKNNEDDSFYETFKNNGFEQHNSQRIPGSNVGRNHPLDSSGNSDHYPIIQEGISAKSEGGKSWYNKIPFFGSKNDDSFQTCKVTFHVHLPQNVERHGQPMVIGSCEELGRWSQVGIMLEQPDRGRFPTYWRSETVDI